MSLKFVNLHGHDGQSIYDAIGTPEDYADWVLKNAGEDSGAFAITNHGNMNSIGHMVATQQKYSKKGVPLKIIYGLEAYYIPSIKDWHIAKEQSKLIDQEEKKKKKKAEDDDASDLVVENERESKSRYYNPVERRNHLVLVAMNQKGLENLYRLVSRSYRYGFYRKPRVDLEMLRECNEGLVASTACLAGVPSWCSFNPDNKNHIQVYDRELLPLMDIFGKDRFFLELQFNRIPEQQVVNKHIIEYSKHSGFNLIATADCHYPDPSMWRDREIYRLLGYQNQKKEIDLSVMDKKIEELDCDLYLKNGDQIFKSYEETFKNECPDSQLIVDAIQRTFSIAHDLIGAVKPNDAIKLPKTFQVTEQIKTPFDQLKKICLEELKKRGLQKQKYVDRAIFELQVIKKLGVSEYFLAKKQILDVLRKQMLTGPARGSGAGSLVCYLLNITFLDPIRHGLLFERFLSPSRAEMPDVDSDVSDKEEALKIIQDHFGQDNVLAISNYNRLQLKSLVKDISKLYSVPFEEVNAVTKVMEKEARPSIMEEIGHDQKLYELTFEKTKQYSPTFAAFLKDHPEVGECIENLFKEVKAIGRHAGGVLVVPDAEACLPIIRIRGVDQSPIVEGITAQYLKYFGLVKFDILGLATLRIIKRCIEIILKKQGNPNPSMDDIWEFYNKTLHPDVLDPADASVFEKVYHKGQFPSIFQFSQKAVQNFCIKAAPNSVNDISAITALWRPGPLKGKANERYLWAAMEKKPDHPIIEEILGETRGLLLYQEQFMLLANKLAGFTLEEADKLRKLLVKPATNDAEQIKKERKEIGDKFIASCIERGVDEKRARKLWEDEILGFISYGFNKSHSQAYAYNSYQCAWLFTYYEEEWIKACLERDPNQLEVISALRNIGYTVSKPDVNLSAADEWYAQGRNWIPAFTSMKGVGDTAAEEIIRLRPKEGFKDLQHFLFDGDVWRWKKFNKKALAALIKMEALDCLSPIGADKAFKSYRHLYDVLIGADDAKHPQKIKDGKLSLDQVALEIHPEEWTTAQKVEFQREIVGFYDKNLIIGKFLKTFEEFNIQAIDETEDEETKTKVWALVEDVQQKVSKNKKPFLQVKVSGVTERGYTFRIWNTTKAKSVWHEGKILVFSLNYDEDWGYNLPMGSKVVQVTQ